MALWWFGTICILLIIAAIAFFISFIEGEFYFSRVRDNDQLAVEIRALYGLVKFRYAIPVIQFKGFAAGIFIKRETLNQAVAFMQGEDKAHITKDKVVDFFKRANLALESTRDFYDWFKQTMSRVACSKLTWITRVGIGDASQTAVTTGAIWGIKSSLLGFGFKYVNLIAKPEISVIPQYNEPRFTTELVCKGRIRMWHAVWAGVSLLVRIAKVKGGFRTWYEVLRKPRVKTAS